MQNQQISVTRRYFVNGTVQGVWYRRHIADNLQNTDIDGWVRNCQDGQVEVLARTCSDRFLELESLLWEGSPMSSVTSVRFELVNEIPDQGFRIIE